MNYLKNYRNFAKLVKVTTALAVLTASSEAFAFNINDAIITAHENNYQVLSEFQNLQATKMQLPKAVAAFIPRVSFSKAHRKVDPKFPIPGSDLSVQTKTFTIQQSLFNGGGDVAQIKIADTQIKSGYERFKIVSNDIALQSVKAYENVLTTREIYALNIKNEHVLAENLRYTQTRFKHGEVTKTDVLQSEAEHARAISDKERAYGDMQSAEATFIRVHGLELPEDLETIKVDAGIVPSNVDDLMKATSTNNPTLLQSRFDSDANRYNAYKSYTNLLPDVTAQADYTTSDKPQDFIGNGGIDGKTYTLNITVPILQSGGAEYADIFEKEHLAKKANLDSLEIERKVKESSIGAWNDYRTAKAVIVSSQEQISSSEKALEGVKEEAKIGTRTTLDVLQAERDLFNAKVNLRTAQRDLVVSVYTILQLMGAIEPVNLAELAKG